MTPNLNATGHWWVRALAWFNFKLEYQKGHVTTLWQMCSVESQLRLDPDMVRSIFDGVALGVVHQAEVHNPTIVKCVCSLE